MGMEYSQRRLPPGWGHKPAKPAEVLRNTRFLCMCAAVQCDVGGVRIANLRPVKARLSEEGRACGALGGQVGGWCVEWPSAGEVLGGTHLCWGLGKCLEPPHTLAPQMGPVESS